MALHGLNKGKQGEREVANALNGVVRAVLERNGYNDETIERLERAVQRNQNQSAVGGRDLVGTFGFAVEVKRQEALAVDTWWRQCVAQAERVGEVPVLVYRQNRKAWRVRLPGTVHAPLAASAHTCVVEVAFPDFLVLFQLTVEAALRNGYRFAL